MKEFKAKPKTNTTLCYGNEATIKLNGNQIWNCAKSNDNEIILMRGCIFLKLTSNKFKMMFKEIED